MTPTPPPATAELVASLRWLMPIVGLDANTQRAAIAEMQRGPIGSADLTCTIQQLCLLPYKGSVTGPLTPEALAHLATIARAVGLECHTNSAASAIYYGPESIGLYFSNIGWRPFGWQGKTMPWSPASLRAFLAHVIALSLTATCGERSCEAEWEIARLNLAPAPLGGEPRVSADLDLVCHAASDPSSFYGNGSSHDELEAAIERLHTAALGANPPGPTMAQAVALLREIVEDGGIVPSAAQLLEPDVRRHWADDRLAIATRLHAFLDSLPQPAADAKGV